MDLSTPSPMDSVACVIPVYRPGSCFFKNLHKILEQVSYVIVVDDFGSLVPSEFLAYSLDRSRVTLLKNNRNLGVAASLNRGIAVALRDKKVAYLLTLDQDTNISSDYVARQVALIDRAGRVGAPVVGSAAARIGPDSAGYDCRHAVGEFECSIDVIQSGLLLQAWAYRELGDFDESLIIDCVDTEFALRMHRKGFHIALDRESHLNHKLGSPSDRRFLGRSVRVSNHRPFRRYYITRNRILLLTEYGRLDAKWSRMVARRVVRQSVLAVLVEERPAAKLAAVCAGVIHGLTGRRGEMPKSWRSRWE